MSEVPLYTVLSPRSYGLVLFRRSKRQYSSEISVQGYLAHKKQPPPGPLH